MGASRLTVAELARQLGVHAADVIYFAKSNRMQLVRAAAQLTAAQEHRLREAHKGGVDATVSSDAKPAPISRPATTR